MADYPLFAGKYELVRRLAVGGMGEIYLADERRDGQEPRRLVVKRILRSMAADPMFVTMFTDEARIALVLDHPNIVQTYDIGESEGMYYIVMEFLDGRDLSQVMGRAVKLGRSLGLGNALQMVYDIAAGAHYAHLRTDEAGDPLYIVHRDLSPRNIMVTFGGTCKILDFGLAKARNQVNVTLPGKIKGTPSYLAPEQLDGKPVAPSTDIFALGTLLFELTTLRRLFRRGTTIDTMRAVKACQIPKPSTLVRRYPPLIEAIVMKALRRDPKDRFQTAAEVRDAIGSVMDQLGVSDHRDALGNSVRALMEDPSRSDIPMQLASPHAGSGASTQTDPPTAQFPIEASSLLEERSNLPVHKTRFIGRNATLKAVGAALDSGSQCIAIYGPPGTGKSRLAIEFARARRSDYRGQGGAWLCDMEGVTSVLQLCGVLGDVLSIPLQSGGGSVVLLENIGRALAGRGETLIVFDGIDLVVDQLHGALAEWLEVAPEVRFVLTSRRVLRMDKVQTIEVPPLALPGSGADPEAAPSVALFVDRAHLVKPTWEPTRGELAVVAKIVNRLDGIPLAIELAAARMADLDPKRLLEELARRLDVLAAPGGGSPRRATLDGAIDWSWNQLRPWERTALAQCSVFHGGFDMEAADAVIDLSAHPDAPWVVDVLQSLRNNSLVRSYEAADFPGEPRCRQYVSIRAFSRRKLEELKGLEDAMERHSSHYLRLGEYWSRGAGQRTGVEGRKRLALELPNLLALHRRMLARKPVPVDRITRAMEAALCIAPVIEVKGPFTGFLRLLDSTLGGAATPETDPSLRAQVLLTRGHIYRVHGAMESAKNDFRAVMELARATGDRSIAGRGLTEMGSLRIVMGQHMPAQDMLRRALKMHKEVGDVRWQGRTLLAAGDACLMRGESSKARACFEGALPRFRAVGDAVLEGACLGNLGALERASRRLEKAREYLEQAVAIHRGVGAARYEGWALASLGTVAHEQGALDLAQDFYRQGLRGLREVGDRRWEGMTLGYLGVLLHERGALDSARKRLDRSLALLCQTGDTRRATFVHGALGAVACAAGDLKMAESQVELAEDLARKTDDPILGHAIDVYKAYVDIAESLHAPSAAGAELLRDAARDRLVRAMIRAEPEDKVVRSDLAHLYRLSVRLLKQTVEAADAGRLRI